MYIPLNYANLIWGQNPSSKSRIITLQKKALRIINNQPRNNYSGPLFKKSNILKFGDIYYKLFKPSYKTDSYGKSNHCKSY